MRALAIVTDLSAQKCHENDEFCTIWGQSPDAQHRLECDSKDRFLILIHGYAGRYALNESVLSTNAIAFDVEDLIDPFRLKHDLEVGFLFNCPSSSTEFANWFEVGDNMREGGIDYFLTVPVSFTRRYSKSHFMDDANLNRLSAILAESNQKGKPASDGWMEEFDAVWLSR